MKMSGMSGKLRQSGVTADKEYGEREEEKWRECD